MGRGRRHYEALDALRGFAALSVVFFHLGHWFGKAWLAGNAGFAVDFFFCLSGFVISDAYHDRIGRSLDTAAFVRLRLIRLMPMIVLGTIISAAYFATRHMVLHDAAIRPGHLAIATMLGILCLPDFRADRAIGGPQLFPLNGPQYTLFLELFVNVFWVLTCRLVTFPRACAIAVAGYAVVALIGLGGDTGASFLAGFPRVLGSFYAGVAMHLLARDRPGAAARLAGRPMFRCSLAISVAFFCAPWTLPVSVGLAWSLLVAPVLILSGAAVRVRTSARGVALFLGNLSYPIYALHYPIFVWVNASYQELFKSRDFAREGLLILGSVLIGSWFLVRIVDAPVRARLSAWTRRPAIA